ncbi:gag-pol polyprotein [Tanacetum coccineum]
MSNSNTNLQTQSSNALHNAIMEAGSKDRPPMLAPVPVAEGSSETTTERYMENYKNVSQDIRDQLNAEAEAVQIILTGIDNDIYSTVDACPNACEMWKTIERLKQGESINVQDIETNLYWNLENSHHGMFLLQLQPEWQRFVTLVKQSQELKTVSYHKLYDILKQRHNEGLRKSILSGPYVPSPVLVQAVAATKATWRCGIAIERLQPGESFKCTDIITIKHQNLREQIQHHLPQDQVHLPDTKAKRSPNQLHLNPSQCLIEDSDPEQARRDKICKRIWPSLAKYTPRYNNDNQSGQFRNQRTMIVAGTRETVGSLVVQQTGIQCFNCKGFGHYAKECRKPKRVKDYTYHKEKMMMCKQAEQGVPLQAKQAHWLADRMMR